jgi:hypothetical protein
MFHFPWFALQTYVFSMQSLVLTSGVAPFGYSRIKRLLATPRDFSQLAASFIAFQCLGIHHTPLVA